MTTILELLIFVTNIVTIKINTSILIFNNNNVNIIININNFIINNNININANDIKISIITATKNNITIITINKIINNKFTTLTAPPAPQGPSGPGAAATQ